MKRLNNHGFTILELMIATTVFSFILLLCTAGIIQIGRTYYKGATLVRAQNVARDVMDNISQAIQFGGSDPTPVNGNTVAPDSSGVFCVGANRYTYKINQEVSGSNHGLIVDNAPALCTSQGAVLTSSSQELLGENMRLSQLSITKTGNDYDIIIKIAYGADDLIVDNASPIKHTANDVAFNSDQAHCKGGVGDQFCSTAQLETTVHRRLSN